MTREELLYTEEVFYPSYVYAGFMSRVWAFIIDMISIQGIFKILILPFVVFLGIGKSDRFFSIYNLINIGVSLGYFFLLTAFNKGQTLGKMILGIRVISETGEDLDYIDVFYREVLGRFIMLQFMVFYIIVLFTDKKQQLGDIFAGTLVVNENSLNGYYNFKREVEDRIRREKYREEVKTEI